MSWFDICYSFDIELVFVQRRLHEQGSSRRRFGARRRMPWEDHVSTHCLVVTGVIKFIIEVFSLPFIFIFFFFIQDGDI